MQKVYVKASQISAGALAISAPVTCRSFGHRSGTLGPIYIPAVKRALIGRLRNSSVAEDNLYKCKFLFLFLKGSFKSLLLAMKDQSIQQKTGRVTRAETFLEIAHFFIKTTTRLLKTPIHLVACHGLNFRGFAFFLLNSSLSCWLAAG